MKKQSLPRGWEKDRVDRVLEHYEAQTDMAAVAEDEAAFGKPTDTAMEVPVALLPEVRKLLAKHRSLVKRPQPARKRVARG